MYIRMCAAALSVFIVLCLGLSFVIAPLCLLLCPLPRLLFVYNSVCVGVCVGVCMRHRANPFVLWHLIYF